MIRNSNSALAVVEIVVLRFLVGVRSPGSVTAIRSV